MRHGVNPVKHHESHLSTRTFGATEVDYTPFNFDAGYGFPDQNAEGQPEECTVITQTEVCQDQDRTQYDRAFTRKKTDLISGQDQGPYDIDDSIDAVCVFGVGKPGETDAQAEERRRGRAFWLEKMPGMDWFDSAIALMRKMQCSLSFVSPWFEPFEEPIDGLMPEHFPLTWSKGVPGHNHKCPGIAVMAGQVVILDKSWQGPQFGVGGYTGWTRVAFNELMDIYGSAAFVLLKWDGSVQTVELAIITRLRVIIRLQLRLLARVAGSWLGSRAS